MTTNTTAEFKTMLKLCILVSILEEEIDDRRWGKTSRGEFSIAILEGGLPLSYQQEITIIMTSVVPSGKGLPTDSPEAALAVEEAVATTQITTIPHRGSNQEEVEVS